MKQIEPKPSWADAPAWATHLMQRDTALTREYGWAEFVRGEYFREPLPQGATWERVRYLFNAGNDWRVAEARPAAPADDEPVQWQYRMPGPTQWSAWMPIATPEAIVALQAMAAEQPEKCQVRALFTRPLAAVRAGEELGRTLQQFVGAVNAAATPHVEIPATWADAERIAAFVSVDEALMAFSHDSTADNAVGVVQAVLEVVADICTPAAQKANLSLGFADTPLLVAELAMFIRIIASKVKNGRDASEVIGKALECQRQHGLGSPLRGEGTQP